MSTFTPKSCAKNSVQTSFLLFDLTVTLRSLIKRKRMWFILLFRVNDRSSVFNIKLHYWPSIIHWNVENKLYKLSIIATFPGTGPGVEEGLNAERLYTLRAQNIDCSEVIISCYESRVENARSLSIPYPRVAPFFLALALLSLIGFPSSISFYLPSNLNFIRNR